MSAEEDTTKGDIIELMEQEYGKLDESTDSKAGESVEKLLEDVNSLKRSRSSNPMMNTPLIQIENILIDSLMKENDLDINPNDISYLEILYAIRNNEISLSEALDDKLEYIMEYIIIYTSQIITTDLIEYTAIRESIINKSFENIKNENIMQLLKASEQGKTAKFSRFGKERPIFNKMLNYSNLTAMVPNPGFRFFTNGDCTNFASQILWKGGMSERKKVNASGSSWYYSGWNDYSRAWTVAHTFMQYWTADGATVKGFTTSNTSGIQANAKAGDFLAYSTKKTYQIDHIAFVDWKSNGQLFVSQHSKNRKHDNWIKEVVNKGGLNPYGAIYVIKFF